MFDGVPLNKIIGKSEWKKLPKGWTYDTILEYKVTYNERTPIDITDPREIIKAYNEKRLIDVKDYDYAQVENE